MLHNPPPRWLQTEPAGAVTRLRITEPRPMNEDEIKALAAYLEDLIEAAGARKVALDFGPVEYLSSSFVGVLVAVHKKLEAAGGRLVLFGLRGQPEEVLHTMRLTQLLHVAGDEQEALQRL
jgi:anti-anti-sigma factor